MRRASRQRTAVAQTTSTTPSAQSSVFPASRVPPRTEVVRSGESSFGSSQNADTDSAHAAARNRQLALTIRQRIESRLVGRVRELVVRIEDNTVVLEGKCSTYYSKQLAQHAALGALEDEQLENSIVVEVPR